MLGTMRKLRWRARSEHERNLWTRCARSDRCNGHPLCARNLWAKRFGKIWYGTLDSCRHRAHRADRRDFDCATSARTLGRSKHRDIFAASSICSSSLVASMQTSIVDMRACQPVRDAAAVSTVIFNDSQYASRFVFHRLASHLDSDRTCCDCGNIHLAENNHSPMDQLHCHRFDRI